MATPLVYTLRLPGTSTCNHAVITAAPVGQAIQIRRDSPAVSARSGGRVTHAVRQLAAWHDAIRNWFALLPPGFRYPPYKQKQLP
ncbi:MAG: hypothetical protein H6965_12030 [Chromatiaceae bacterium]|nr:hypothetical protein [Chromatiaceae bacterium]